VRDFNTRITLQEEQDDELLEQSFNKLLRSVSKGKRAYTHSSSKYSTTNVINDITGFFGCKTVNIPVELEDIDLKLNYMQSITGIMSRKVTLREKWWLDAIEPIMCKFENKDIYILLYPKGLGGYEFVNPVTKRLEVVNELNSKNFESKAIVFYKPLPCEKITFKKLLMYVAGCISVSEIILILVVSVAIGLAGTILPIVNRIVYDRIIPSGTTGDLMPIAVVLAGSFLSIISAGLLKDILFSKINNKVICRVQSAAWARVLSLPAVFFKKYSTGEVFQRLKALEQVCNLLSGNTVSITLSTAISFVYLYQIAVIAPKLLFPTIIIIFVLLAFSIGTSILEVRNQNKLSDMSAKLSGLVYQILNGIAKIRIAGARTRAFSKWADNYSQKASIMYSPNIILTISGAIYNSFAIAANILIYMTVSGSNVTPAQYLAFNAAFGAFLYSLFQFQGIVRQVSLIKSNFNIAKPLLDEIPENIKGKTKTSSLSGNIDLSNISFRYTKDGPLILDEISLSIKPGEYVAIVGTTGCGKSTLMRLLLGFEQPETGAVYYDNKDLASLDLHSIRQQIGVVMQNATLFADDIFSNISICAPWLTLDDAWEVAERAGIAEDIREMPMGMFTMISEGGAGISGGQKQRLMIARALANKPQIIMFDEATSALDNITQAIVVNTLERMSNTRIVIAHRLSTIKNCHRIIVMHKGKIVEEGNYKELIDKGGLFADMAKRQIA